MPTYYALINVRYPGNGLECHGQFTDEAEARQFIEKELTDLYGNVWERLNDIQYAKKDDLGAAFVMALLDIRYSPEEQERQELDSLPRQIAVLQERLAELQAKYPPAAPSQRTMLDVLRQIEQHMGPDSPAIVVSGNDSESTTIGALTGTSQPAKLTDAQLRELDDLNVLGELTYNRKTLPVSFKIMQSLYDEGLVDLVGGDENTAIYRINEAGRTALDGDK